MDSEDVRDPIPDYKFMETVMDVSLEPNTVFDLSDERLLLLLHLLGLGLYLQDQKQIGFALDAPLDEFLRNTCSDSPEHLAQARILISEIPRNEEFYMNLMNLINTIVVEFLKSSSNLTDEEIKPGQVKVVEQLFSFLQDPEEISAFSDNQFLMLVSLLVHGAHLNEINALGFYLNDEITELLRKFTPTKPSFDDLKQALFILATEKNEHAYENFSSLINFILYNVLKNKF